MHDLDFFPSPFSSGVVGVGAGALGDSAFSGDSDGLIVMNSPAAMSREVRPSCGDLVDDENHPPGKKRDDVVDVSLVRAVSGEDLRVDLSVPFMLPSSSTGAKRDRVGLEDYLVSCGRRSRNHD
jgi:hypothetical protein